jgi:hypothetical protein
LKIATEMSVWELADLSEGCELIGNKWTFVKKKDVAGNIVEYQARLVAQQF